MYRAGRAAGSVVVPLSVRDGSRLCAISGCEFPFIISLSKFNVWFPPIVVSDYTGALKTIVFFFRGSVVGIVHDLEDVDSTDSGILRRIFKLADDIGVWIHRFVDGKHVESDVLENVIHI